MTYPHHGLPRERGKSPLKPEPAESTGHAAAVTRHSPLMPAALITFAHLVISLWTKAVYCSGVLPTVSAPSLDRRLRSSGVLSAFTISPFSLLMIGRGVLAGAETPYHVVTWNPGIPLSATVGMSGTAVERFNPVTARGRNFPARTCWITLGTLPK